MAPEDEHHAKQEILRLEQYIREPVLLIGGLAVQQYHRARRSRDLDLVCSLEQLKALESEAYPTQSYEANSTQNDLRPNIIYRNLQTDTRIYLGPKIIEREPYKYIFYDHYFSDSIPFTYDDQVCNNVRVPSPHHLAFSKLVSHIDRRPSQKGLQDLSDFSNLTNHRDFALNRFLKYIERVKAKPLFSKYFNHTKLGIDEQKELRKSAVYRTRKLLPSNVKISSRIDSKKQKAFKMRGRLPTKTNEKGRLPLSDIYYGSTDANYELDSASAERINLFYETYFHQSGLSYKDFFDGTKYIVYGYKGTGKTSFLRYLEIRLSKEALTPVKAEQFRFRADFPNLIYDDVRRAFHGNSDFSALEKGDIYRNLDYEAVWTYTLLKQVRHRILDAPGQIFQQDDAESYFCELLNSIVTLEGVSVYRFLPSISNGSVDYIDPKDQRRVNTPFGTYVQSVLEAFKKLSPVSDAPLYFMIDEIEPRTGSGVLFELDCILIRDLLYSIKVLNSNLNSGVKCLYFLVAIRSEVLGKTHLLGEQTSKLVEHFGAPANWGDVGSIDSSHPLIQMICKKFAVSEKKHGLTTAEIGPIEEYIWPRYFRKNKREQLDPKLLLDLTWHRPRDLVRLLDACRGINSASTQITESLVSRARKRYSSMAWADIAQFLNLSIDPHALEGIEACLIGITREFTLEDFKQIVSDKSKTNNSVSRLARKYTTEHVLSSLYASGVVGTLNSVSGHRFVFRGDEKPDLEATFVVHRGLWSHFSVLRPKSGSKR